MLSTRSLVEINVKALREGAELLTLLDASQYTQGFQPAFQSTIGAHFRHLLEHYRCLLTQLESAIFCYDNRQRDQLLECDIEYARSTIEELMQALSGIDSRAFDREYHLVDMQVAGSIQTTLHRELLFLQSHTVHHFAIIGAMTRAFGKQPDDDFGVAIATREHQKTGTKEQPIGDTPACAQ